MDITKWVEKVKYGGMYISELEKLHEICKDKNVLEIGSMVGMSSGVIADSAKHLTCVDVWSNDYNEIFDEESREHYREEKEKIGDMYLAFNLNMYPWLGKVDVHKEHSESFLSREFQSSSYDVILLDGDHSTSGVTNDVAYTRFMVNVGGLLCLHDYDNPQWPGVKHIVDNYVEIYPNYQFVEQVETLRIYRRVK